MANYVPSQITDIHGLQSAISLAKSLSSSTGGYSGKAVSNRTNYNTNGFVSNGTDTADTYRTNHKFPQYATNLRFVYFNGYPSSSMVNTGPGNSVTYTAGFEYGGSVQSVTISAGGSSYATAPAVTFSAPPTGGTQATGTAVIAGGAVTNILITNPGSLYTSAPSIALSGGGGSGASATSAISTVFTYQVTFNGSASAVVANGQSVVSDPIPVDVFAGTTGYSRTCATVASGGKWVMGLTGYAADTYVVGSDSTTSTGALASASQNKAQLAPAAILGTSYPAKASVLIIGDSITYGYYDVSVNSSANVGYIIDALEANGYPYIQMGRPSSQASQWSVLPNIIQHTRLFGSADWAWIMLGTNDATNARTLQQLQNDFSNIVLALRARGLKVAAGTICPNTTSTDNWRTVANQTATVYASVRIAFNNWIRTNAGGLIDAYVETADAVESARNSGIWKGLTTTYVSSTATSGSANQIVDTAQTWTTGQWLGKVMCITGGTGAGQNRAISSNTATAVNTGTAFTTAPDSTSTYVICDNYTIEGTHPTPVGHAAMAAAVTAAINAGTIFTLK